MDTEIMLPYQDFDINDITLLDYTEKEMHIITSYIELSRHLQEINQLFEIFQYNLKRLLSIYELNNRDTVIRHVPYFEGFSDRIELNALLINYISSGKTLIDSIESCIKTTYSKASTEYTSFRQFLSSVYDNCFSYRLLTRLRDFAQHGHLPVSVIDNIICFDIAQITNTPHFKHNNTILTEMEKFNEQLLLIQKSQSHHVFTLAVAEYTTSMCNVYYRFWLAIYDAFLVKENKLYTLITENPQCIVHRNRNLNGWLFYLIDDTLHTFNTEIDSLSKLSQLTDEAKQIYELEERELNELRKSLRIIKLEE